MLEVAPSKRDTDGPAASWCQGLAGIADTLLATARATGDTDPLRWAVQAADIAVTLAPRMPAMSRCCGLAGVGEYLIDLHTTTGDPRHRVRFSVRWELPRAGGAGQSETVGQASSASCAVGWVGKTWSRPMMRRMRSR
ncbi:lanthionine synthetase LanC family protein [Streptomyces microflavus]